MAEPQLRAHLHYIELGSSDPEGLAAFYGDAFDMRIETSDAGWIGRGPERILAFGQGAAGSLLSAGYAVDDPEALEGLARRLSEAGVPVERGARIFDDDAVTFHDPDGNRIAFGTPREAAAKSIPACRRGCSIWFFPAPTPRVSSISIPALWACANPTVCWTMRAGCGPASCVRITSITAWRFSRPRKTGSIIIVTRPGTGT